VAKKKKKLFLGRKIFGGGFAVATTPHPKLYLRKLAYQNMVESYFPEKRLCSYIKIYSQNMLTHHQTIQPYQNVLLSECTHCLDIKKVKVKWSRYRPNVAHRVGRGIALLFHDHGSRRGWVVSSTSRPHFTPRKDPVLILHEAGWAPGPVRMGGKSRP